MIHLVQEKLTEPITEVIVDGFPITKHILWDLDHFGINPNYHERIMATFFAEMDTERLVNEIHADLEALEMVSVFLCNSLAVPLTEAMRACLNAFEAQSRITALKLGTRQLIEHAGRPEEHRAFVRRNWFDNTQISVRARCILRRAGHLLARYSVKEGKEVTVDLINSFNQVVDEMFMEDQKVLGEISRECSKILMTLVKELPPARGAQDKANFISLLEKVKRDPVIRTDIFEMMIAMGFPGGTDIMGYFEDFLDEQHRDPSAAGSEAVA
jgi:hypothetical protein